MLSLIVLTTISISQTVNAQEIRDGIYEDQAIICINGAVIEQSGNICKVVQVEDPRDIYQSLSEVQEELYKNPDSDTFEMDVRD